MMPRATCPHPLRRGEQDLRKALATEQGAWMDFNARLDELERSLPASRR
jgi:hypothetical protein